MIEIRGWAKFEKLILGIPTSTKVKIEDASHYILYLAKDGLTFRHRLYKATSEHQAGDGLAVFESAHKDSFL